ncbi:MAG: helix-turn-helix transcriptional regulator [Lachnospiraceae bacterium]|nr:helix-turn-helix transcriptional regulator [Lachnospiraceae bacterium]
MIRLRVLELLEEQNHTKYWLHNQMDLSYKNLSNLINNETISIRFENIERLCKVLNCTPNDLFEIVPDEANEIK